MRLRWTVAIWMAAVAVLAGCTRSEPAGQDIQTILPAELSASQQTQHEIAQAARDALFQQLVGELMGALSSSGPAAAIEVCGQRAPEIAADVSRQYGVRIGRTSHRLRNPNNASPDWAKSLVDEQVAEPQLVALADRQLGALFPIRLKAQCVMCHGPQDQILPDVQAALAEAYPKDRATGFREGDLRGWFWVSVPSDAQMPPATDPEDSDGSADVDTADET